MGEAIAGYTWYLVGVVALFFIPYLKRLVYFPYLYFHELGHSLMAMLLRLRRQRMQFTVQDGSGKVTAMFNHRNKLVAFLFGGIGYVFPVIVVYLGVLAVQKDYTDAFFIGLIVSLVYGAFNTRSFIGWVIVTVGVGLFGRLIYLGEWHGETTKLITVMTVWVVGIGCINTIRTLVMNYKYAERAENGDASLLSRMVGMPVGLWVTVFVAVNIYSIFLLYWLVVGKAVEGLWV